MTETCPKNINQSVWIDILDSDDDIEETIQPFDGKGKLLIRRALSIVIAILQIMQTSTREIG